MPSDLEILGLTLRIAAASTVAIFPIALGLAIALRGLPARTRTIIDAIASLPLILPPTAVGFVLFEALSRDALGRVVDVDILFTPRAAVIAAAAMSFPLMYRSFRAAVDSADFRYYDIARTLGAKPVIAFVRVILPLSWYGIVSGLILGYCRALSEFGATMLIAGNIPGRTQTIALAIYDRVQSGTEETAVPLVLYVILLAFAAIAGSEILMQRQRRKLAA